MKNKSTYLLSISFSMSIHSINKPTRIITEEDAWKYVLWYTVEYRDSQTINIIEWWHKYHLTDRETKKGMVEDLGPQKFWMATETLKELYTEACNHRNRTRRVAGSK